MKKGDQVTIEVAQEYSTEPITYEVLEQLDRDIFLLMHKKVIVIGRQTINKLWTLSKPFNLLGLRPNEDVYHQQRSTSPKNIFIKSDYNEIIQSPKFLKQKT